MGVCSMNPYGDKASVIEAIIFVFKLFLVSKVFRGNISNVLVVRYEQYCKKNFSTSTGYINLHLFIYEENLHV